MWNIVYRASIAVSRGNASNNGIIVKIMNIEVC